MTLQPTDAIHTAPQGVSRSTWQCAFSFVLALGLAFASTSVDAAPGGARLSSDLQARLAAGRSDAVDVIVSGTPDRIERLARRHGLTVKKTLSTGAVLTASGSALARAGGGRRGRLGVGRRHRALADGGDHRRRPAPRRRGRGSSPSSAATSGRGVGVAIIDSGIAGASGAGRSGGREPGLHRRGRARRRPLRSRHAHRRHRRGAVQPERRRRARRAAWHRARTCST